jgi:hypothetical protein
MPEFCMHAEFTGEAWRITYDDGDPGRAILQVPVPHADCLQLPPDEFWAPWGVESRLQELLDEMIDGG